MFHWSMIHAHIRFRELIPEIYLTNIISPLYVYCYQHQNMIKGMIALSISPFLVVDDNMHISPKDIQILALVGASFIMNSPSMCAYKILEFKQDAQIESSPIT